MGASRKLQGEIDRVLKKVQEGVDLFDTIWNKVYHTDNANQKEKFEGELKKEIKKLQRYRDQIKTWIQSTEIRDKKVSASYEDALVDARKQIEREMERFKICEKEAKTKAFSKEGLGQLPKTDPKEKAKSETRDWLNNVVGELESQIDNFEAELEGLSIKKGKTRPPRLTHLETSIERHKTHIKKLELILRLLDNDELSPEQLNDVKDSLDDYVERNQEDFDEFSDVDDLYDTLPLEKVEALEDLVNIGPPIKGTLLHSLKNSLAASASQVPANSAQEQADDIASHDSISDTILRTPLAKSSIVSSFVASTPTGNQVAPLSVKVPANTLLGSSTPSPVLSGANSARSVLEAVATANPSSPLTSATFSEEDEIGGFPGHLSSPLLADASLVRSISRGGFSGHPSSSVPISSGFVPSNGALGAVPSNADIAKRNLLGAEERLESVAMGVPLGSPLSNRMMFSNGGKCNDGICTVDSGNVGEAAAIGGNVLAPSLGVTGMQWRQGSSFHNQNEPGQIHTLTEIPPHDQQEKLWQQLQQVQEQGNILGMTHLASGKHMQFSGQHNPLLPQFDSPSSSVSPQVSLGLETAGLSAVSSASLQQSNYQQNSQQVFMSNARDADLGFIKVNEQQQPQNLPYDSTFEYAACGLYENLVTEEESKNPFPDTLAGASGFSTKPIQIPWGNDLSPGAPIQPSQPSSGVGVIGRRSIPDIGAIGDCLSGSATYSGALHDQLHYLHALEFSYHKLPQPEDSERPRSYTPMNYAVTPPSFPQTQAPIIHNPALWERLTVDTLFFAFYYQQNTHQQYLAAKELKKQSWRFHKKYHSWFQRHEEPIVTNDDFENGSYVYFDFNVASDDVQNGWCQRIKTDFTFEYNFLEEELI